MKKHIILSLGRSGSNYLANFLNNHPQITNYGEVLGEWTVPYKLHKKFGIGGNSFDKYLDFIYSNRYFFYGGHTYSALSHLAKREPINFKWWRNIETIGIKDFSMNFTRWGLSSYLRQRGDILVINLYRENILKRFISLEKMERSGVISVTKAVDRQKSMRNQTIFVDVQYALEKLNIFEQELHEHNGIIQDIPETHLLNIRYEDFFESPDSQTTYEKKILRFLDVSPISTQSSHRKILSNDLRDIVENYDELERTLVKTRFSKYL